MKTHITNPLLAPALIAGLSLILAGRVRAQIYTNFGGVNPNAALILSGDTLYGTAAAGGSSGFGTVFAVNTDGSGFRIVHDFTFTGDSDGANPWDGLILSGNTLYGTAYAGGGGYFLGTVFGVNTDGTGFTNLHSFTGGDGANPIGGLILTNNTLYGTTRGGGSWGLGTVFSLSLGPLPPVAQCKNATVAAGANCNADASIDDGSFSPNAGDTITLIQSPSGPYPLGDTGVTLTVTDSHGASDSCVATVHVEGAAEQITGLIALVQSLGLQPGTANSLLVKLQGAASALDQGNLQAAFGSLGAFLNEANAQAGKDLTAAQAHLLNGEAIRIRAVLGCGTAGAGGSSGNGTVFSISFRPQLTITPSGTNVILSWPTNAAGFDYTGYTLQSATNLDSPAVWSTNSPAPVVIAGQNTVTNPITGAQKYYRLVQ